MIEDELDRNIVRVLRTGGKLTYEEISKKVNRPPSTVRDRIKKIEADGTILGYSIVVDNERLGIGCEAFVSADIPPDSAREALSALVMIDQVSEVLQLTGEHRIMFRICEKSGKELARLIDERIRPLGFRNIKITIVMDRIIRFPGL